MSTAPPVGSQSGHDWLVVGTTSPTTPDVAAGLEPTGSGRRWLRAAMPLLLIFRERCATILRSARVASTEVAGPLLHAIRNQSVPDVLAAIGRRLPRIPLRPRRGWLRVSKLALVRAHPVAAMLASALLFILGYLAYCIATIPSDGGLVIEPTPSALVVEADGGQVFATRGSLQKVTSCPRKMCRLFSRKRSSPSKIVTFTSTPASICHR